MPGQFTHQQNCQLIVYACPVGELADQLERYYEKSQHLHGPNSAHYYPPHCSLTGFFDEQTTAVARYTQSLDRAYRKALRNRTATAIEIVKMEFRPEWHGLILDSSWLQAIIIDFACKTPSPTRRDAIRPKTDLHLSFAYNFQQGQSDNLRQLAEKMIDPTADCHWELRFYRRDTAQHWTCHRHWSL